MVVPSELMQEELWWLQQLEPQPHLNQDSPLPRSAAISSLCSRVMPATLSGRGLQLLQPLMQLPARDTLI